MIKENTYFAGGVKSLGFTQLGEESSIGVMLPGEFTFGTAAPERMTVVKGTLTIKRAGDEAWQTFHAGSHFDVDGHSSFEVKVKEASAYLCEYLSE